MTLRGAYGIKATGAVDLTQEMVNKLAPETSAYISQYNFETWEYKDDAKRYRLAKALPAASFDPAVPGRMPEP